MDQCTAETHQSSIKYPPFSEPRIFATNIGSEAVNQTILAVFWGGKVSIPRGSGRVPYNHNNPNHHLFWGFHVSFQKVFFSKYLKDAIFKGRIWVDSLHLKWSNPTQPNPTNQPTQPNQPTYQPTSHLRAAGIWTFGASEPLHHLATWRRLTSFSTKNIGTKHIRNWKCRPQKSNIDTQNGHV